MVTGKGFPSPTGVNHYESATQIFTIVNEVAAFPSPTGVNHYE